MEQESPRGPRPYLDESDRRLRLQGRTAQQGQAGSEPQLSGPGFGQLSDLPPPPLGQGFSGRSSMPSISGHSSSSQLSQQQPPAPRKGGSSIGSTGQGSNVGSSGWPGSQWSSTVSGWRQDGSGLYSRGAQPSTSIGNTSIGGPAIGAGGFGGPPPLSRSSTNQGMIGARQSQMGSFGGHLGSFGPGQGMGSHGFGSGMIGGGALQQQQQLKPPGFGSMPTSSLPHSAQPSSSFAMEAPCNPFLMGPSLGSSVAKFAIGQSVHTLQPQAKLADSVTSLNLSQSMEASSKSIPPALPEPPPPAQAGQGARVKVICNSGGQFVRMEGGAIEYQGGETRLVSVRSSCTFKELMASLERVMAYQRRSGSSDAERELSLRFQLPQERGTYVDLVDNEDVQLMFDEWQEYADQPTTASSAKLQVFVDLQRGPARPEKPHPPKESKEGNSTDHSDDGSISRTSTGQPAPVATIAKPSLVVSDRLEIILPEDVSLVKFLGSGGYGEVYLGKWHSSEAAIKCLNASLFYPGGAGRQSTVNHAAVSELLKEAEIMARLRHPNIVWVYGVVLPPPSEPQDNEDDDDFDTPLPGEGPFEIGAACHRGPPQNKPGSVRAPAIVTEFLSQGSLRGVLARKSDVIQGPLVRVLIAMDAAKGMEYLHSKKIVHFDLKSANLLLGNRDRRTICKVADFGLSKQKMDTYVSGVSSQRGTLPWIAPEIIKTPHAVNEMVDVYSFGIVLWELWTGKEPYEGLNYHALLHQITTSTSVRPPLPGAPDWDALGEPAPPEPAGEYSALVQACWHEKPAARPTFTAIVAALKRMAAELRPQRRASAPSGQGPPALPAEPAPQPFAQAPGSEPASPHGNRQPAPSAFVQQPQAPQ